MRYGKKWNKELGRYVSYDLFSEYIKSFIGDEKFEAAYVSRHSDDFRQIEDERMLTAWDGVEEYINRSNRTEVIVWTSNSVIFLCDIDGLESYVSIPRNPIERRFALMG